MVELTIVFGNQQRMDIGTYAYHDYNHHQSFGLYFSIRNKLIDRRKIYKNKYFYFFFFVSVNMILEKTRFYLKR